MYSLRPFRDNLSVLDDVDRRAVHARCFTRRLRGLTQGPADAGGETFGASGTTGGFHGSLSNSCRDAPELSYTAQDSAMGW
jgi:hypothetical protein